MYKQRKTRSLYFSERITEAMNGIFDYPLTIVEAPMGYGKTTAVREHLNNTDANVLWQRVYDSSTDSSGVNNFIELLLGNEITNLHIVLIARFTELQSLEELTLKGYLHHVTKETFELLPKEIAA